MVKQVENLNDVFFSAYHYESSQLLSSPCFLYVPAFDLH
jgi:hypothetical protein